MCIRDSNEDVRRLEKLARPFGAVFLDVNGMKEIKMCIRDSVTLERTAPTQNAPATYMPQAQGQAADRRIKEKAPADAPAKMGVRNLDLYYKDFHALKSIDLQFLSLIHIFSLGFQDTLSNLIGGLQVSLLRIIKPGDNIEVGSATGVVKDITWRHTTIRNGAGEEVLLSLIHI